MKKNIANAIIATVKVGIVRNDEGLGWLKGSVLRIFSPSGKKKYWENKNIVNAMATMKVLVGAVRIDEGW